MRFMRWSVADLDACPMSVFAESVRQMNDEAKARQRR